MVHLLKKKIIIRPTTHKQTARATHYVQYIRPYRQPLFSLTLWAQEQHPVKNCDSHSARMYCLPRTLRTRPRQRTTHSHTAFLVSASSFHSYSTSSMSDIGPMQDQSPEQEEGAMDFAESPALRPVFLGNLNAGFTSEDIAQIFERPMLPPDVDESLYQPVPVDRVDLKRGFCFVFLKDANSESEKENAEKFVSIINGMYVPY